MLLSSTYFLSISNISAAVVAVLRSKSIDRALFSAGATLRCCLRASVLFGQRCGRDRISATGMHRYGRVHVVRRMRRWWDGRAAGRDDGAAGSEHGLRLAAYCGEEAQEHVRPWWRGRWSGRRQPLPLLQHALQLLLQHVLGRQRAVFFRGRCRFAIWRARLLVRRRRGHRVVTRFRTARW